MLACMSRASWGCVVMTKKRSTTLGATRRGRGSQPVCVLAMQGKEGGAGMYETCRRYMHQNSGWEVQLSGLS